MILFLVAAAALGAAAEQPASAPPVTAAAVRSSAFEELRHWALREFAPEAPGKTAAGSDSRSASPGPLAPPPPPSLPPVPSPGSQLAQGVIDALANGVGADAIGGYVAQAADKSFEGRGVGTKGGAAYRDFLERHLSQEGFEVERQPFTVPPLLDFPFGGRRMDKLIFPAEAANIVAKLPGSDPQKAQELVLLTAHFDHLVPTRDLFHWAALPALLLLKFPPIPGVGPASLIANIALNLVIQNVMLRDLGLDLLTGRPFPVPGTRKIFPGADDNGSGTASLLAMADAFAAMAKTGAAPRRTILLCFFDGEEVGLRGSKHWIDTLPPEARDRIVQVINLDMVGWSDPEHPDRVDVIAPPTLPLAVQAIANPVLPWREGPGFMARHNPILLQEIETLNGRLGVHLEARYTNREFNGSDQYSFFMMKRPDGRRTSTVMFYDGGHGPYHREGDQAARIDKAYAARVARLAAGLAWAIADSDAPPEYVP